MQEDGSKLKKNLRVEAEICIVGCGPGGLTLARELLAAGLDVVVLESGSVRSERRFQALNDGEVVGDPYRGLRDTRHRQVGGAANIWNTPVERGLGAKYVPLDPWDLSMRPDVPLSGWPFGFSELEPFYRR
ncbi:MAG: FAD-dependent monooxygenase, partial [Gemmatimonadetes bacterium]|nr:FAD-dependent monooxygenase [Gemmatimonadota bacterium]